MRDRLEADLKFQFITKEERIAMKECEDKVEEETPEDEEDFSNESKKAKQGKTKEMSPEMIEEQLDKDAISAIAKLSGALPDMCVGSQPSCPSLAEYRALKQRVTKEEYEAVPRACPRSVCCPTQPPGSDVPETRGVRVILLLEVCSRARRAVGMIIRMT